MSKIFAFTLLVFCISLSEKAPAIASSNIDQSVSECRASTEFLREIKIEHPEANALEAVDHVKLACLAALNAVEADGARKLLYDAYRALFRRDMRTALGFFDAAANKGYLLAHEAIYRITSNSKKNAYQKKAIESIKLAAQLGSPQASFTYGAHLVKQPAVPDVAKQLDREGMPYLWLASEFGESSATLLLSKLYGREENATFRPNVSARLLLKAAHQGSVEASLRWAKANPSKVRNNDEEMNRVLRNVYLIGTIPIIKAIYDIYHDQENAIMSQVFLCIYISTMQPGLSPLNGAVPGQFAIDRPKKLKRYQACVNELQ